MDSLSNYLVIEVIKLVVMVLVTGWVITILVLFFTSYWGNR